MVSQKRIFVFLTLLLLLTMLLGACQRPFPRPDNGEQTNTTTNNETANDESSTANAGIEVTPDPAADEEEGEAVAGSDEDAPAEAEEEEAATEPETEEGATEEPGDTPRVEEEATPEPTETPVPEPTAEPTPEAEAEEEEATEEEAQEEEVAEEEAEEEAAAAEEAAEEETAETTMPSTHVVAVGENLYRIGLQYGVSWVTLAELNNLNNPNNIVVGQELQLPGDSEEPTVEPTPSPATETTYTIQPGDNLFRIGLLYNLSWIQIAEANGIVNPNQIIVGQVIKIPVDAPGPTPQFAHEVKQGESLFLISLQYGVPWPNIAEANELAAPYVIYPGQMLVIPGG